MDADLEEIALYSFPNWDGYGADPVGPQAIANADTVLRLLKAAGIQVDVAPGADGSVGFEFVADGRDWVLDFRQHYIVGFTKQK